MKKIISTFIGASLMISAGVGIAGVKEDRDTFQGYFLDKFPILSLQAFQDGPYAFDADKREQFNSIMEFPPFEDLLDKGARIWEKPFKNGKTFSSCFSNLALEDIRPYYPRWDAKKKKVLTLEGELRKCLVKNKERKWGWRKGKIAYVSAHLTQAAIGKKINVIVPENDENAVKAYEDGKNFFYAKRGQFNISCANCHITNVSKRIRGNVLSAPLGNMSHFPVWRGAWAKSRGDGFGTLQRRFAACEKQLRSEPLKSQQSKYNNLEFFLTAMSNGIRYNGVSYRE